MGSKYSTVSVSGYNATPPSDDGSQTASNQVKWDTHKSKLGDPLKTAIEAIDTALVAFTNFSGRSVTDSATTAATDHMKTIEIASTTSSGKTISLMDASTAAAGYIVSVKNLSAYQQTIGRVTTANGIDGVAANKKILPNEFLAFKVNAAADGYFTLNNNKNVITPLDLGAVGDGSTDDTTAIRNTMALAANFTTPVTIKFNPGYHFLMSGTVSCDLPSGSTIQADGAKFTCTHNGLAFDLNPDATAGIPWATTTDSSIGVKYNISWNGGWFINTSSTKTSAVAIRAYMMRVCNIKNVQCGDTSTDGNGFFAFVEFAGKDSYHFENNFTRGCARHYWVPDAGVVFTSSLSSNNLINVAFTDCHMSLDGTGITCQAGIYFDNVVNNFCIRGGSLNGAPSVAQIRFDNNATVRSQNIQVFGTHLEQIPASIPGILFVDSGSTGFEDIDIGGATHFESSTNGWYGVTLARCTGVNFGVVSFVNGGTDTTCRGIYVDDNSTKIKISEQCVFRGFTGNTLTINNCADNGSGLIRTTTTATNALVTGQIVGIINVVGTTEANNVWTVTAIDATNFDLQGSTFSNAYSSGGTAFVIRNAVVLQSATNRQYITVEPEVCAPKTSGPLSIVRVLTNYAVTAKSTTADTTIDMSAEFIDTRLFLLPPKGYWVNMSVNDSGSAAAGLNTCFSKLRKPSSNSNATLTAQADGATNDSKRWASGYCGADENGDVTWSCNATGAGTLDVLIAVTAVHQ
jgi:hypothetical protein